MAARSPYVEAESDRRVQGRSWSCRSTGTFLAACSIPVRPAPPAERVEWNPDGRTLYYKAHDAQGRASFWAVNAAGGVPRLLVRFTDLNRPSSRRDFATDGKRFYFAIEDRQSDVFVADLNTK